MCGIWSYLQMNNRYDNTCLSIDEMFKLFMTISHRGPDSSLFQKYKNDLYIGFHRLEIMDPTFHSNQPYVLFDDAASKTIIFMCNGEIYNYEALIQKYDLDISTHSDCLTIPKLYLKSGCDFDEFKKYFVSEISGEYAFVLYELDRNQKVRRLIYGRDKIGIRPLYICEMKNDDIVFSSEVKGLNHALLVDGREVENGTINCLDISTDGIVSVRRHFDLTSFLCTPADTSLDESVDLLSIKSLIKNSIINAVKRRMSADQPIGFLLSGGVDSSLVAAIAAANTTDKIKTFCCGLAGGTDLEFARMVAEHIGSEHTEVIFSEKEALQCLQDVVYTTETWDTTTIRASVGQYLVSKYIAENTNIKVLLVGEGPDEVCSSYLFNYYAPSSEALDAAAKEYVKNIHLYDCRRVDRCSSRWGLECRVPLLDPEFIEAYWSLPPAQRHPKHGGIEKYIFRSLFENEKMLPAAVLWRKKEAFSDGISHKTNSWFSILQSYISESDKKMTEKQYYRNLFTQLFRPEFLTIIPKYWQPKWIDDRGTEPEDYVDPSARVLAVYSDGHSPL